MGKKDKKKRSEAEQKLEKITKDAVELWKLSHKQIAEELEKFPEMGEKMEFIREKLTEEGLMTEEEIDSMHNLFFRIGMSDGVESLLLQLIGGEEMFKFLVELWEGNI